MEKLSITPTPWKLFPPGSVIGHSDKAVIKPEWAFDWVASCQVSNVPQWQANAKAIVTAVNSTYGQSINPEAVKDLYDALCNLVRIIDRDRLALRTAGINGILHTDQAKAAIEKAKL